jgi:phosphoesterase RecJ-like protein
MNTERQKAFEQIKASERILLHLHPKPDLDSIGSALATYHALKSLGKKVVVIKGDSVLPESFSVLPGYENIVHQNYFETKIDDFDLGIFQDSGSKQMISRKGEVVFPSHLKTIVIDHHKTNEKYGNVNIVDASYASTTELLYDLFKEWGIEITKDIAINLYVGMYSDTGGFKYSSTTPRTFKTASAVVEIYPDFPKVISKIENSNAKGKIYFDALALSSVETFFNDSVAISCVSFEDQQKKGVVREDSDNNYIANMLIGVKEWQVAVTLIEKSPSEISISFRSKGPDVSISAQKIGGGGHALAAGATLLMSLQQAKEKVLESLSSVIS